MEGFLTPEQLLKKYKNVNPCSRWSTENVLNMFRHFHVRGIYRDNQVIINETSFLKFIDRLAANPDNHNPDL